MCCLLQCTLYGKTIKRKTSHKWKAYHKKKNFTSCQSLSVTDAVTVMVCKILILLSKKSVREYKCYQEHCVTCTFKMIQTTKKSWLSTPAPVFYACRYSFAMSTRVCNVLLTDFVKKSRFECCFWSTQCIETQARTSDNVKTGVFISLNVQWWSFTDNVVYCNILRSIKAAFFSNVHRHNSCSNVYHHHSWSLYSQ